MGILSNAILTGCLASLALAGCSPVKEKPSSPIPADLAAKVDLYKQLQPSRLDEYGWAGEKCDSALVTSLCLVSGGCPDANIYDAESETEPGRWYRHKLHDCYDLGQSASDISKDMFAGLAFVLDDAAKARVVAYGQANDWVMGRGPLARTYLTPPLRWLYTGWPVTTDQDNWLPWPINTGYRAHLDILSILLRAKVRGGSTTDIELAYLKAQVERLPRNALFQAAYHKFKDGDQKEATAILLDETLFPADSLPTDANYCTDYLWSRDEAHDWNPCEDGKRKDATDFLFAAWVAFPGL